VGINRQSRSLTHFPLLNPGNSDVGGSGNAQKTSFSTQLPVCLWRRLGRHRSPRSGPRNSSGFPPVGIDRRTPRTPCAVSQTTASRLVGSALKAPPNSARHSERFLRKTLRWWRCTRLDKAGKARQATDRHCAAPTKKRRNAIRNTLPKRASLSQRQ
jgi:hypothetical protein